MDYSTLAVAVDGHGTATVTMNRPEARNAFDDTLITELTDAARRLGSDDDIRVVVLTGAGPVFSAGADLHWMRAVKEASYEEGIAGSVRMDTMLRTLWDLPKPLVGRINGHALGGGSGLTAVCDIAVAVDSARFGFTEVLLGIAPAVISPYVVRKIGRGHARALFVNGARFDAARAERIGLVHRVVAREDLDDAVRAVVADCLRAGPRGAAVAKTLPELALDDLDTATSRTPEIIARLRASEEGQEGMGAFLDKRSPAWVPPDV